MKAKSKGNILCTDSFKEQYNYPGNTQRSRSEAADSQVTSDSEKHVGPAWNEAWCPGEPQEHQQDEDGEHCDLCKLHGSQFFVLILHHLVPLSVPVGFVTAAKGVLQAEET